MGRPNIPHSGPHLQYNLSGIGGLLTFEDIDVIEMPPLGFQPSFEELMPSEKSMFEVFSALAPVIQPPGPDTAIDGGSLLLGGLAITSLVGVGVFYYYNKKEVDQAVGAAAAAVGTAAETVMTGASDAVDAVTEGVEKIVENLPSGFHDVHTAYPDMFPGYPDEPFGTFVRAAYVNEAFIDALGQTPRYGTRRLGRACHKRKRPTKTGRPFLFCNPNYCGTSAVRPST